MFADTRLNPLIEIEIVYKYLEEENRKLKFYVIS